MMTTAIMQASSGRPGRVFLANFLGGPLITTALVSGAIGAVVAAFAVLGNRSAAGPTFFALGVWPVLLAAFFFLSNAAAGLGAAIYAAVQVKKRGTYSVLIAVAIAMAVAFACNIGGVIKTGNGMPLAALFFAAFSTLLAGWLARRSGASWR